MASTIGPQPGPQSKFLSTSADIGIYGGAAGGGKTYALLLEPLRNIQTNRKFNPLCLRRTTPQITNPGGLWQKSAELYSQFGATPRVGFLEWKWPKGGTLKMSHLEHEISVLNYQGAEVPLILFDELTHFSESQFWYMVSRNRSMSGVRGYVRATCNPDPDSWVAKFIAWWIDQDTGYPIPERAGVVRWMIRVNDTIMWGDSREWLIEEWRGKIPDEALQPKSVTFIPAKLSDNVALTSADPGYIANLLSLPTVERERLLGGNWKIRPAAGLYFKRRWLKPIEFSAIPAGTRWARGWDLAATEETPGKDPDFTESCLMGRCPDGRIVIADHTWMRGSPAQVDAEIKRNATQDRASGRKVRISLPQDPGQAGKSQSAAFTKLLVGYDVRTSTEGRGARATAKAPSAKSAKIGRFGPFSAQCEGGQVYYVVGQWNEDFFDRLEAFPEAAHDDTADCTSRAFETLFSAGQPAKFKTTRYTAR